MWSWLTANNFTGPFNGGRGKLSFLSSKREFNLPTMQDLHTHLLKYQELPDKEVVETLRVLSEFLIYSDQNRSETINSPSLQDMEYSSTSTSAGAFFDYFCEKNILGLLVEMGDAKLKIPVQIQLLQTLSILVQNIATRTSLYYLLSNNYVNKLIECPFEVHTDDDVRDWYVTFLKALSLRLNEETVQFFFTTNENGVSFPLYVESLKFGRCSETMVKVAVKTLTLNVLNVQDSRVQRFVMEHKNMEYFMDLVEYANEISLKIQGLLNLWSSNENSIVDRLEEAIEEYIDHCFYLQDILDVNLPELCYKLGDFLFTKHIKEFLAASILPDCNPPSQRVSTLLALYLLTRFCGIFEHAPLVNAVSFMLLCTDAPENCLYSAVALGAGARRSSIADKAKEPKIDAASPRRTTRTMSDVHEFRSHSKIGCDSPLCYVQTRYSHGEWPIDEVEAFVPIAANCFRQSILELVLSKDELLSSSSMLLLLSIMNSESIDHSLLRELDLLPARYRRHKKHSLSPKNVLLPRQVLEECDRIVDTSNGISHPLELINQTVEAPAAYTQTPSQFNERDEKGRESNDDEEEDDEDDDVEEGEETSEEEENNPLSVDIQPSSPVDPPRRCLWLIDTVMQLLKRCSDIRILNTQLAVRILVDLVALDHFTLQSSIGVNSIWLRPQDATLLRELHSISIHEIMQSMKGALSDVDLFIYVLEDEYHEFAKQKFPFSLNLKNSSPYEFLLPLEKMNDTHQVIQQDQIPLIFRHPSNDVEVCRNSMQLFLALRRAKEVLESPVTRSRDNLDQFVVYRHHATALIEESRGKDGDENIIQLKGMVTLPCMWREQRFFRLPARMCLVLNPEALVLVEKEPSKKEQEEEQVAKGRLRLFSPIHRVYATIDAKDDLVLHATISSTQPIENCRAYHKVDLKENHLGNLKSWHASILFENEEDCRQAKAHIDLCRAEVRAFKLTKIEESLNSHIQVTKCHSVPSSPCGNSHVMIEEAQEKKNIMNE